MYIYWIAMALLIVAGGVFSQIQHNDELMHEQAALDTISRSLLIYRSAASEYARANPAFAGVPPEESLNLPTWYTKQNGISAFVTGGVSFTYVSASAPAGLAAALAERTESTTVGVNHAGLLSSPKGGRTTIAVPAQVPEGAVVAVY